MNDILKTIYERRAVRKYLNIPVERKITEQIVDAGRMAPSAMNKQPCNFLVLTDKQKITALSKEIVDLAQKLLHLLEGVKVEKTSDMIFHGAPVVIFISTPRDNEWAGFDVGMSAQNIMLAAKSLGLDTCPIGFAKYAEHTTMLNQLHVPKGEIIQMAIILGYADEKPVAYPRRKDNLFYID